MGKTVLSDDFRSREGRLAGKGRNRTLRAQARPEMPVTTEPPHWLKDVGSYNIESGDVLLTSLIILWHCL